MCVSTRQTRCTVRVLPIWCQDTVDGHGLHPRGLSLTWRKADRARGTRARARARGEWLNTKLQGDARRCGDAPVAIAGPPRR